MGINVGAFQTVTALFNAPARTVAVSGTATASIDEADIVAGSQTIILTVTNGKWIAAGAAFNAQRQGIIDGLDSAQSETLGWNNEVRDKLAVTTVVRSNDTQVTITLSAQSAYDITATETITVTVPAGAIDNEQNPLTATPTIQIDEVVAVTYSWGFNTNGGPSNEHSFKVGPIPHINLWYGHIILDSLDDLDFDNTPVFGGPFGPFWQRTQAGTNQIYTIEDHGDGTATYYITVNGNNLATRTEIATEFGLSNESDQFATFVEN